MLHVICTTIIIFFCLRIKLYYSDYCVMYTYKKKGIVSTHGHEGVRIVGGNGGGTAAEDVFASRTMVFPSRPES